MAHRMSRKDKLVLQFMWLALGTFLFGIWAIAIGFRSGPPKSSPAPSVTETNQAAPPR
jgi:hypothetical protein